MANMPNDFWSGWIIVLTVVSLAALIWLLYSVYFSSRAKAEEKKFEDAHPVWDGDMEEGHAAPPMWWFWFLFCALVFTAGYLMLYPGLGSYKGALEWSQDSRIKSSFSEFTVRFAEHREKVAASSLAELQTDPAYMSAAEGVFKRNCAMCHGLDAKGQAALFPDLTDDEWQWGGSPEAIEHTIRMGRNAQMVAWKGVLNGESVAQVADYVIKLDTDESRSHPGSAIFGQYCAACHGADGRGNPQMGAPNLANDSWLYGGDPDSVKTSIVRGRQGVMPAFGERLTDAQIKLLVAWLARDHSEEAVALSQ
ncbi:cytochrome-c oxidase, cbb3-type subunit III [Gilvimarinus sp. F26214L]|uniref:cytochrome-c oxidase, cbb3-type subunit III n=1 Tax=Gilvimarinus sp. DZF01 TaxID=3461371 RepID=UPI0040454DA8